MESLLVAVKRLRTVKRSARPWASAQVGATFARWRTMMFRLGRDKHWSLPLLGSRPPAMLIAAVLAIGGTVASVGGPLVGSSEPVEYGIWGDDVTPGLVADRETKAVTLGVKFKSADHGWINGIQFYRSAENVGPHRGQLWTSRGKLLATVEFPETDEVGWLTARFDVPVEIVAGRTYVASYRAPEGRYAGDVNTLSRRKKATTGSLTAWQGVYTYGLGRPDKVWWNSNYYVDVLFSCVNMSAPIAPETKTVIAPATPVPATTVATTVPATTVATTVPATTVATTVPATTVATTVPATTVATTVPATTVATTVPATTVATTVPATTVATTVPATTVATTVPATTVAVAGACAAGGSVLWGDLVGCGWPGAGNTGYPAGLVLRSTSGRTITADNAVIDGERVTGSLTIAARNVTVRNSLISYQGSGGGGSGAIKVLAGASALIDRVEIDGNSAVHTCVWHEGASVTVNAVNCHDMEDGFFAWAASGSASSGDNFTITNSYVHGFNAVESNGHFDGFQTEGAANGVIRHNTFDLPVDSTGAISIWNERKDACRTSRWRAICCAAVGSRCMHRITVRLRRVRQVAIR